jgi:hypothetical protein
MGPASELISQGLRAAAGKVTALCKLGASMIPVGYMTKRVLRNPDWILAPGGSDVYLFEMEA